jgi:hypothetical protein
MQRPAWPTLIPAFFDINTFRSPSPLPSEIPGVKRKAQSPVSLPNMLWNGKYSKQAKSSSPSTSSGSEDEADIISDDDSGSDVATSNKSRSIKDPNAPARLKKSKPTPVEVKTTEGLPKARLFVIDNLVTVFKEIFGGTFNQEETSLYAAEVEENIFENFKDGQGSKAVAGGRYK